MVVTNHLLNGMILQVLSGDTLQGTRKPIPPNGISPENLSTQNCRLGKGGYVFFRSQEGISYSFLGVVYYFSNWMFPKIGGFGYPKMDGLL